MVPVNIGGVINRRMIIIPPQTANIITTSNGDHCVGVINLGIIIIPHQTADIDACSLRSR